MVAEAYQNKMGLWVARQLKKLSNEKKAEELPKSAATLVNYMQRLLQFLSSEVEAYAAV